MKKIIILLLLILTISSCAVAQEYSPTDLLADEIVTILQDAGYPIDNVIVYDEETDPNHLLGRPGRYTSKTNFADTRIEQYSHDDPIGGTVEVFDSESDCKKRYDYIAGVYEQYPQFEEYMYQYSNVLFRISFNLSPKKATQYDDALKALMLGNAIPMYSTPTPEPTNVQTPTPTPSPSPAPTHTQTPTPMPEPHIYDHAQIMPMLNGIRTERIGSYSIVFADSTQCTDEALADWYFNHVAKGECNWYMILYTDKENMGVYESSGMIYKDVSFEKDQYGDYNLGSTSNSTRYVPDNGTIVKL